MKRIVVKVGTSTLTHASGLLNLGRMEKLVRQLADLHNRGLEVVLVTSGAIGAGVGVFGLKERPKTIPEKQACAAAGQLSLMHMYQKMFSEYGKICGQILLTAADMADRQRFLNSRNTFFTLLSMGAIPIVNENDAVVVAEIKVGDNDTLSAMVAALVEADQLVILSDIDGLYDSDPRQNSEAKLVKTVNAITPAIEAMASGAGSKLGTGGMATKIKAARIATSAGCAMRIVNGSVDGILLKVADGEAVGTLFQPSGDGMAARHHWLIYDAKPKGKIHVDMGAAEAVRKRKSLLPKGVTSSAGRFEHGDVVLVLDPDGNEVARGISNYAAQQVDEIKGLDTKTIEKKLGCKNYDEVIHVNNLVIKGVHY
jgi:glutamate 5-kinase